MPLWAIRLLPYLGAALLVWGAYVWAYNRGEAAAQAELAAYKAEIAEERKRFDVEAREREARHSADMARIGQEHAQELKDAQAKADRVVADLRSGNLRLQERWRACAALPRSSGPSGEPDAAERDREESAARIVSAAAACDAQVRGLQDVILSDREQSP